MSRLPRAQEHLKTGFTAEAMSAALFRAYAEEAESRDLGHLAEHWRRLAREKDRLAILQLEAAGRVFDPRRNLAEAVAGERYENEVLYPRLLADLEGLPRTVVEEVVAAQRDHLERLEALRQSLTAGSGDVEAPEPEREDE